MFTSDKNSQKNLKNAPTKYNHFKTSVEVTIVWNRWIFIKSETEQTNHMKTYKYNDNFLQISKN